MRLYERTTAKEQARWDVTVDRKDTVTGRRTQERKTFTTRKEAQVWLSEHTVAEKHGTAVTRSTTTVSELLALWLQTHKPNVCPAPSPATRMWSTSTSSLPWALSTSRSSLLSASRRSTTPS